MRSPDRVAQEVRLRRFATAALTSLMVGCLAWGYYGLGYMDREAFFATAVLILGCIVGFYLVIRSGGNENLPDPSMTIPMIVASCTVNTFILYSVHSGRGAFLLIYVVSMLFGVFRLSTRELAGIAGFVLISYGLVVWRLHAEAPAAVDLSVEFLQWIVLACVVVWFSFMGGYISSLINRLGQAEFDELTGAYTRRRIIEIFRHEKLRADRSAGPLSVCMLDIDRLKTVNDTLGHQGGDQHLKLVVSAVQQELRGIDYIGRYGGDEFLVIMTETPLRGALECAERIRHTLEKRASENGSHDLAATVSMGIAEYQPGESLTQTVGRADAALYAAKAGGRDRIECALPDARTLFTG